MLSLPTITLACLFLISQVMLLHGLHQVLLVSRVQKGTPFAAAKIGELIGEKAQQIGD